MKHILLHTALCCALLCVIPACVKAQTASITIAGTVIDENEEPVVGASVSLVDNHKTAVITDINGKYSLTVPVNGKIKVSYIGYQTVTVAIKGAKMPTIQLDPDTHSLNEVVAVGYGALKKKNLTGSIEVINAEDLTDLAVGSLSEALIALSPAIHVEMPETGRPGETATISIRQARDAVSMVPTGTDAGGQSIGGDADPAPLYVIDDFNSTEEAFNNLDIDEVESITVLKDASAAVYGAYGAYGVILVQTKRGKEGTPRISYNGQYGYVDAVKHAKMLNGYEYGTIFNAAKAAPTGQTQTFDMLKDFFQADELEAMKSTNYNLLDKYWSSSLTQKHSINLSGGNKKATYFGDLSYYTQDGNIGKLDYDKWNFRAGAQAYVSNWFRASVNISGNYEAKDAHMSTTNGRGSEEDYLYMMRNPPYVPDNINGYPIYHSGMANDPSFNNYYNYLSLYNTQNDRKITANTLTIQASLEHDFSWYKPLKGLRAKFTYSKNIDNNKDNRIKMSNTVYRVKNRGGSGNHLYITDPTAVIDNDPLVDYDETTLEGFHYTDFENLEARVVNDGQNSYISREMTRSDSYQLNFMLTYARDFGKHNINATFSIEKSENESENTYAYGSAPLSFTDGQSNSLSDETVKEVEWNRSEGGSLSYIGRANYSFADKYLFQFLMRMQASTKFAPENYWGAFPSVSGGWVMSEESWFDKEKLGIDFLKFRSSFGLMGRDNVEAWRWLQLYTYNAYDGSIFGTDVTQGSARSFQLPEKSGTNRNLHWDKNYKFDFGIDARVLDGHLGITFDAYYDWSREMFLAPSTSVLPGTVGIYAAPENYGEMDDWGVELMLTWHQRFNKDMMLNVKIGTGYDDNKILVYNWDADPTFTSLVKGERSDRGLWGYSCIGMFRSYQEINEYFEKYHITSYMGKSQSEVEPGMLIYEDIRGAKDENGEYTPADGVVDSYDMVKISNRSDNPYRVNSNILFNWKNFQINATFQAEWGAYTLYPSTLRSESLKNMETDNISCMWKDMFVYEDVYDASDKVIAYANRDGRYPNIAYSSINSVPSTFWRVSAAEVLLRYITIAYSLPKKWIKPLGMSNVRLNMTCQNALSFYNPLPDDVWDNFAGTYGKYPTVRKVNFGVKITF